MVMKILFHVWRQRQPVLEVRQKPGGGATQLSVRWRLTNDVEARPIPGARTASLSADFN